MALLVPSAYRLEIMQEELNTPLTLKLYGNDKTPAAGDSSSGYTEIAGGGYIAKALVFASWTITEGSPVKAKNATQTFTFTSVINAPGSIYGYYVIRDSDGKLLWAERFPAANVPFAPINGSKIIITPIFNLASQF